MARRFHNTHTSISHLQRSKGDILAAGVQHVHAGLARADAQVAVIKACEPTAAEGAASVSAGLAVVVVRSAPAVVLSF